MYKIDKNIPLPNKRKYPFEDMDVGDSFFIPCARSERRRIQSTLHNSARTTPATITTRFVKEGKTTGVRVWVVQSKVN